MRRIADTVTSLVLAGIGSVLVACAAVIAAIVTRQATRAAPIHPFGAAAGLLALPLGMGLWFAAKHRLAEREDAYVSWSLRELS